MKYIDTKDRKPLFVVLALLVVLVISSYQAWNSEWEFDLFSVDEIHVEYRDMDPMFQYETFDNFKKLDFDSSSTEDRRFFARAADGATMIISGEVVYELDRNNMVEISNTFRNQNNFYGQQIEPRVRRVIAETIASMTTQEIMRSGILSDLSSKLNDDSLLSVYGNIDAQLTSVYFER